MFKTERQSKIMEMLQEKQFCSVQQLSAQLYVAPVTVRRDLAQMELAGLLRRCHGGAAIPGHQNREVPFDLRDQTNAAEKASIGRQAAAMLHEGDTVFMDASTTVSHVADFLSPDLNLTVVTNSIKILEKLKERHIRCYLTGGMLLENSYALIGNFAEQTISGLYADICFFSTQGITRDGVITDYSEAETRLRQVMLAHARRRVYLFDGSKLGKQFMFRVCTVRELEDLITDAQVSFEL